MRPVSILGVGMSDFGVYTDTLVKELVAEVVLDAISDAGVGRDDISYATCGNFGTALFGAQGKSVGQLGLKQVGITELPVVNVENGGATGAQAFRLAWQAVASGEHDIALAVGVEKMRQASAEALFRAMAHAGDLELEGANGIAWPALYAMAAQRRMHDYGTTREVLAQIVVNHRANGAVNPRAQLREPIELADVLEAPLVAEPFTRPQCCPTTDGAAAVLLVASDRGHEFTGAAVDVLTSAQVSGSYSPRMDLGRSDTTRRAAAEAYATAGITPKDIDLVEIHDAFPVEELITLEELGFCDVGEAEQLVSSGATRLDGEIPFCPSGGLLSLGHPIGATGIAQLCELVWQLRGEAGDRQVKKATRGLAQVVGTFINTNNGCEIVTILERS